MRVPVDAFGMWNILLFLYWLERKSSKREKGFTSFKQAQNVFTKLKLYLTASFNWFDFSFLFDTLDVMHQIHRLGRGFLLHQVTKTGVT